MAVASDRVRVIDPQAEGVELDIIEGAGRATAILWHENGGRFRSFHTLVLEAGAQTIAMRHPSDCVYYIAAGEGDVVDEDGGEAQSLVLGAMIHIDAGDSYRLRARQAMTVLGGPCPPDEALYARLKRAAGE